MIETVDKRIIITLIHFVVVITFYYFVYL